MKSLLKKLIAVSLIAATVGCASQKTIDGVTYDTYGIISSSEKKNPNIEYEVSAWSVIWGVLFFQTIIVPIYVFGFDLYQPVSKMDPEKPKGAV